MKLKATEVKWLPGLICNSHEIRSLVNPCPLTTPIKIQDVLQDEMKSSVSQMVPIAKVIADMVSVILS